MITVILLLAAAALIIGIYSAMKKAPDILYLAVILLALAELLRQLPTGH
jgi:hypothetical protein